MGGRKVGVEGREREVDKREGTGATMKRVDNGECCLPEISMATILYKQWRWLLGLKSEANEEVP